VLGAPVLTVHTTPFRMVLLPRVHIIGVFLFFQIFIQNYVFFSQKIRKISQLIEFMLEKKSPFLPYFFKKTMATNLTKIFKISNSNWVFSDKKKKITSHTHPNRPKKKQDSEKPSLSLYLGFRIRISECFILQKMLLQEQSSQQLSIEW
jgi:hypothetical protein